MIHRSTLNPTITSFRPIGDKLLLRRHERPKDIGGIAMPANAMYVEQAKFDVLAAGPKCMSVKEGDVTLAPCQLAFSKVEVKGESLEVAPESLMTAFIPA